MMSLYLVISMKKLLVLYTYLNNKAITPAKNKTKQNKTKQNKTKQNKTKQNTKQNKTKQNKTKQNKTNKRKNKKKKKKKKKKDVFCGWKACSCLPRAVFHIIFYNSWYHCLEIS